MDATLFSNLERPDRTSVLPSSGDVLTKNWALKVSQQIVRAAGFAGSVNATLVPHTDEHTLSATAYGIVQLPFGAFGTHHPPMIFVMPQYGTTIIYKQLADASHKLAPVIEGDPLFPSYAGGEWFKTWIYNLTYVAETRDGTVGCYWSFYIKHVTGVGGLIRPQNYVAPYRGLNYGFTPWHSFPKKEDITGTYPVIALHWYALGAEPPGA